MGSGGFFWVLMFVVVVVVGGSSPIWVSNFNYLFIFGFVGMDM